MNTCSEKHREKTLDFNEISIAKWLNKLKDKSLGVFYVSSL